VLELILVIFLVPTIYVVYIVSKVLKELSSIETEFTGIDTELSVIETKED